MNAFVCSTPVRSIASRHDVLLDKRRVPRKLLSAPPRAALDVPAAVRDLFNTSGTRRFASQSPSVVQKALERHRSRLRYLRHVLGFPTSKLGRRLLPLSLLPVAECLGLYVIELMTHTTPHMSPAPTALTSGIVGLLLAFRTNASLARYYEARGAWASISSRCVDAARIALEYIDGPASANGNSRGAQLARYLAAYPHVVRTHLEAGSDNVLQTRVHKLLTTDEINLVQRKIGQPLYSKCVLMLAVPLLIWMNTYASS